MGNDKGYRSMLKAAQNLIEKGINVIPLLPNSKIPAVKWKEYQDRMATMEEITKWFKETRNNMAIATGEFSGLTVVDCDSQEAVERYYLKCEASGISVKTPGGGYHFYHRYTKGGNKQMNGLDIRNDGGLITAPPSTIDGNKYRWEVDGEMTDFNYEWLEEPRKRIERIVNISGDIREASERSLRYLAKVDPAVSGHNGHKTLFRACCKLAEFVGQHMSPEEAIPLIQEYNDRCLPPWSFNELKHKLTSAWQANGLL